MIEKTLADCLVLLLQGEPVPADNLNGNTKIISLFNRTLESHGSESVSRTIREKALKDDVLRTALAEAESIIREKQAEREASVDDDLEACPALPAEMAFTPQAFPLMEMYMS